MINRNDLTGMFQVILVIIVACGSLFSQQATIDSQFKTALNLYKSGSYSEALPIFEKIAVQIPANQKTTAAYLFVGKTYLQMNELNSSGKYLQDFLMKFPESKYIDEAHLALAKVFYKQENYREAFKEILYLVSMAKLPGYKSYAKSLGRTLSADYLELYQLRSFNAAASDSSAKPYLLLLLALKQESLGNFILAADSYRQVIKNYPRSEENEEAKEALKNIENVENESGTENLLAVLLPLTDLKTGEPGIAAGEILEGIKYAVSEYNKDHDRKVGLIIRDTENDSATISNIASELNVIPGIIAIVGPLFSNEVRNALIGFRDSGIPLISPTATDNDLVDLSDNFFQANPSFYMRGKVTAQYVYFAAGFRKIAVLNAVQGYSPLEASAFIVEFKKLGGEIVDQRTYSSGSYDLAGPVSAIAADSLILNGIFVPLSNKIDAAPLLSQMMLQKINTPVFGNQDWFYARGFETSSVLSNQLSFSSDYFIDYNDSSFNDFSKSFTLETGIDINRNVLYGYDTAGYLLMIINAGADTRSSLISSMESGIEVKGYHNNIAFGKEHINLFLNMVRYSDGKFELIDRFKSGD